MEVRYLLRFLRTVSCLWGSEVGRYPFRDFFVPQARASLFCGADINERDSNGWTPLHVGCHYDVEGVVRLLIEKRAELDARTGKGYTALHVAVRRGSQASADLLIRAGAGLEERDERGRTAVHMAALNGDAACLGILIAAGASLAEKDAKGRSALHLAAQRGSHDCVELLIRAANPRDEAVLNAIDQNGWTALHMAAAYNSASCADLLLKSGAKEGLLTAAGQSAMQIAVQFHSELTVLVLSLNGLSGGQDIIRACQKRQQNIAHVLARSSGASLQLAQSYVTSGGQIVGDADGQSPISLAIQSYNDDLLHHFLKLAPEKAGAGPTSPLLLSVYAGNMRAIELLLPHLSANDVTKRGPDNMQPLLVARLLAWKEAVAKIEARLPRSELRRAKRGFYKSRTNYGCSKEWAELTRRYPRYNEKVNPSWKGAIDDARRRGFSVDEDIKPHVIEVCGITDARVRAKGISQIMAGRGPCKGHSSASKDQMCQMAWDHLTAAHEIERALSADEILGRLRPCLQPIGSIMEGTRLGRANELDAMMTFQALHEALFELREDAFTLGLTRAGRGFFKDNGLAHLIGAEDTFNAMSMHRLLLERLEKALDEVALPPRLRIQVKNRDYASTRCPECCCRGRPQPATRFHCGRCLPGITMTRLGPCLLFQWAEDPRGEAVTSSMDLIPMYPHPAGAEALAAQMVETLSEQRPAGWASALAKYCTRDRIVAEAQGGGGGALFGLKVQHFGAPPNFLIRPGQAMDVSLLRERRLRDAYIAVKGAKCLLGLDQLPSYFVKKAVLKREVLRFAERGPSELELFYKVITQPELRSRLRGVIRIEFLEDAIEHYNFTRIYVNRDPRYRTEWPLRA